MTANHVEARDALAAKLATFLRAKYPEHYYRDLERATDDHETIGLSLQDAAAILELACGVGLAAPPASVVGPALIESTHPEAFCQQCGRRNVVWFAPSTIWNATMGGGQGILCPVCFIEAAEQAGLYGPWIVAPGYSVQQLPGGAHAKARPDGGTETP